MPPDSPPLFSVIVVCKNPGPRLREALASVWAQEVVAAELIVIDGASTDGTREWLESRRARLATLVSAPDHGVYDAMNQGLSAARGAWVYFLGADDRLVHNEVLRDVGAVLAQMSGGVGVGEIAYADGRVYRLAARPNPRARNFVHHQGAFYRRTLFAEHGGFDLSLGIMADYDFNLRLWKKGVTFAPLPLRIATCGVRGLSDSGRWSGYREEITVRHRHFPAWRCGLWDLGSAVRFLRKRAVRRPRPR